MITNVGDRRLDSTARFQLGHLQHGHPLVELDAAAEPLRDGVEHLCMIYIVYVCVYVCVVAAASATDGRLCVNARAVEWESGPIKPRQAFSDCLRHAVDDQLVR